MARTWRRWLPAAAAVALIGGTVTVASQAGAAELPERSPQEVLAMAAGHDVQAFSGTFQTQADLGLSLPATVDLGPGGPDPDSVTPPAPDRDATSADALTALEFLTGEHTGRLYVAGPDQMRAQHLDGMEERNLIVSDDQVWLYDSATNEALHLHLPEHTDRADHPGTLPSPDDVAASAVQALEPSTEVTAGSNTRVAGRDAYTLELRPRAPQTLVDTVRIAVDGETGFPLSVTITAVGQAEPAFHAAYTDIDFSNPDPALFDFTPPPGANVEEETLDGPPPDRPGTPEAEVLGEAWTSVVVAPLHGLDAASDPLLAELTDPIEGGRLLSTSLVSVLFTDDGRVLAGAVTPEHLLSLAGQ